MKKYIKTGQCIWCGKKEPDVSFYTEPHILPRSLGGIEIGYDICDDCNHYFGTATQGKPNIDLVYKEIFNAFRVFGNNLNSKSYEKLKSIFFTYKHSENKIRIKNNFKSSVITRQFKRSLYNVFLQKYHTYTGNGNHPMFDMVRKFARFDIGNPKVYYAFNNVLLVPSDIESPRIIMSEKLIEEMMMSGIYPFWCIGHWFYLEVFPTAFQINGTKYLKTQAQHILLPAKGNEMICEMKDIMDIDFLMERFNSDK